MIKQIRWHIRPDGTVDKCGAEKGNCPYQSTPHFDTELEAQKFSDNENEAKNISEFELNMFYHPNEEVGLEQITLEQLGKSKSYLSRIEAVNNGYKDESILNDNDDRVKATAINNNLFLRDFAKDLNPNISSKALLKIRENLKTTYQFREYSFKLAFDIESGLVERGLKDTNRFSFKTGENEFEIGEMKEILKKELNLDLKEFPTEKMKNKHIMTFNDDFFAERYIKHLEKSRIKNEIIQSDNYTLILEDFY